MVLANVAGGVVREKVARMVIDQCSGIMAERPFSALRMLL
jgi:hypothetical protein